MNPYVTVGKSVFRLSDVRITSIYYPGVLRRNGNWATLLIERLRARWSNVFPAVNVGSPDLSS